MARHFMLRGVRDTRQAFSVPSDFNSFAAVPPRIMLRSARETQRLDDLDRMPVAHVGRAPP
jgi:hypothetical protein